MRIDKYFVSSHAAQRMAERNVNPTEAATVLRYGRILYRSGAKFFFLGERDLPRGQEKELARLVGTTIVVGLKIKTIYRNRRAISRIKRKPKRSMRWWPSSPPLPDTGQAA